MPRHPPCALNSLTTNIQSSWIFAQQADLRSTLSEPLGLAPAWLGTSSEDAIYTLQPYCQRSVGDRFQSPLPSRETRNLAAGLAGVNKQKRNFNLFLLRLRNTRQPHCIGKPDRSLESSAVDHCTKCLRHGNRPTNIFAGGRPKTPKLGRIRDRRATK